ncbi:MAG: transposase, partial [Capnocytophaga sp.]|nr:transposase [Capnocytophaga sp.]
LKSNNKFNRFTFKGLEKVTLEFLLMALGHNFRKMVAVQASLLKIVFKNRVWSSKSAVFVEIYVSNKFVFQRQQYFSELKQSEKLAA